MGKAQTSFLQMLIVSQHFHIFLKCFCGFLFFLHLQAYLSDKMKWTNTTVTSCTFQYYRNDQGYDIFIKRKHLYPEICREQSGKTVRTKNRYGVNCSHGLVHICCSRLCSMVVCDRFKANIHREGFELI